MSPGAARELEIAAPAPAEQTIVQLAFPDVGFRDERYWVGALTEELLGGMSSRLFLEVREDGSARLGVRMRHADDVHGTGRL